MQLAFDRWEVPFDLIHKDHVKSGANLRGKCDVIVVPHQTQGGKALVFEQPKLSKPLPCMKNDTFKSLGMYAQTDDVRGGMGIEGVAEFEKFVNDGGLLMTFGSRASSPPNSGLLGVSMRSVRRGVCAPAPTSRVKFSRPIIPSSSVTQARRCRFDGRTAPSFKRVSILSLPFVGSTPDRTSVIVRFQGGDPSVLSGLMRGADQIRNRPMVVDAPAGKVAS